MTMRLNLMSWLLLPFMSIWTLILGMLGILLIPSCNVGVIASIASWWGRGISWYLAKSGVTVEVEGQENIPEGPFILACKHQSAWETIFLLHYLNKPVYVLKKELMYIPIYGWYLPLIGMIPIERGSVSALKKLKIRIRRAIDCGRPIVIFPEGTRVAPGDSVDYRPGIYVMHQAAPHVPIVPAALNSGLCWPRGTFSLRPGVIKLRFLPQMQGKFSREYLLGELKKIIDKNINSL